jgi:hypothetical protein
LEYPVLVTVEDHVFYAAKTHWREISAAHGPTIFIDVRLVWPFEFHL